MNFLEASSDESLDIIDESADENEENNYSASEDVESEKTSKNLLELEKKHIEKLRSTDQTDQTDTQNYSEDDLKNVPDFDYDSEDSENEVRDYKNVKIIINLSRELYIL